ncbi:MAG: hypothetical protein CMQ19_06095 [Gammaproteobacteria bacterium]|nr:hypothetical protein [Gammaproteobacteria bacterium]
MLRDTSANLNRSRGVSNELEVSLNFACAESFFHTIKVELIHGEQFETRGEMRQAVFE